MELIGHHETGADTKITRPSWRRLFAFYKKYGVDYVKTGYVNVLMDGKELHDSQYGVRHCRRVIETAARCGMMIDNHEPVMPTGIERTWPNLMTQEGVRGQEVQRLVARRRKSARAHHRGAVPARTGRADGLHVRDVPFRQPRLAPRAGAVDHRARAGALRGDLQPAPDGLGPARKLPRTKAFDFIRDVPTDWERTLVPAAVIGDYAVFVRQDRSSEDWYLGAVTDEEPRTVGVPLTFLAPGVTYTAQIYADGEGADWKTDPYAVDYEERPVTAADTLTVSMASGGGCAVRFAAPEKTPIR